MADLPTGTVTFLFTDVEGSTRLWEEHAEAMRAAPAEHDALIRQAVVGNRGHVVKTTRDGVHVAFATADDHLRVRRRRPCSRHHAADVLNQRHQHDEEPKGAPPMTEPAPIELTFEPPGPGTWDLDPVHFPRPATRYWVEIHPAAFARGVSDFMAYYGMMLDTMRMEYVNGFAYHAMVPVADDQVPERFARAEEVWSKKLWRDQLREWDEEAKPAAIAVHRELQAVDPDALSDADLVAYLTRCRDHHAAMISQHMRYTGAAVLSVGDLLADLGDWTDATPAAVLAMMHGAAPVSAGASGELAGLIAAINADPSARELLASDDDASNVLDQLRVLDGDVGRADHRVPRPRRVPAPRRLRHLRAVRPRAARCAPPRDPVRRRGWDGGHRRFRGPHRRDPPAGPRRAPCRVRRARRGGTDDVPHPRRAGRLQRHLGVGHRPSSSALRRAPGGGQRRGPRPRALRRRRLRRDVRARLGHGRTLRRRVGGAL